MWWDGYRSAHYALRWRSDPFFNGLEGAPAAAAAAVRVAAATDLLTVDAHFAAVAGLSLFSICTLFGRLVILESHHQLFISIVAV